MKMHLAALATAVGAAVLPSATLGNNHGETIVDFLVERGNTQTLVAAVSAADLADTLDTVGSTNYTVFAPVDVAFEALGDVVAYLLNPTDYNLAMLQRLLLNHVVLGNVLSSDLANLPGGKATALSGEELTFDLSGVPMVNGAVIKADPGTIDVEVMNGVIHLVESVLVPPNFPTMTIQELMDQNNLPTFQQILTEIGLLEKFSMDQNTVYTLFAPTEEAIATFIEEYAIVVDDLFNDKRLNNLLNDIVRAHLIKGHGLTLTDIVDMDELPTRSGHIPTTMVMPAQTDIMAVNGVLHTVSQVIVPHHLRRSLSRRTAQLDMQRRSDKPTINGVVVMSDQLSILDTALVAANLDSVARDRGARITVFAPVDSAFSAEPVASLLPFLLGNNDYQRELLRHVLMFHILGEEKMADELMPTETNILESQLALSGLGGNSPTVNGVSIIGPDAATTANGIVHLIDSVLLPPGAPTETLWDKLVAAGDQVSIMRSLLEDTGHRSMLESANGHSYTIFAPTNDAFSTLLGDLGVTLSQLAADPKAFDLVGDLLEAHVVLDEVLFQSDVQEYDGRIKAINGRIEPEVDLMPTAVVPGVEEDAALNGSLHILGKVIVPYVTGMRITRRIGELTA